MGAPVMLRVLALAPVLVVATAGSARAEVYVSAGLGLVRSSTETSDEDYSELGPGFQGELGLRVGRTVGVGLHLGISRARYADYSFAQAPMLSTLVQSSYLPIDLGVTLHYAISERISFASWVGLQDQVEIEWCKSLTWHRPGHEDSISCRKWDYQSVHQPSMGLMVSVDLSERERHRVTAFVSFAYGFGGEREGAQDDVSIQYNSAWIGVGYRYW